MTQKSLDIGTAYLSDVPNVTTIRNLITNFYGHFNSCLIKGALGIMNHTLHLVDGTLALGTTQAVRYDQYTRRANVRP